jgi:hypothetical protein
MNHQSLKHNRNPSQRYKIHTDQQRAYQQKWQDLLLHLSCKADTPAKSNVSSQAQEQPDLYQGQTE